MKRNKGSFGSRTDSSAYGRYVICARQGSKARQREQGKAAPLWHKARQGSVPLVQDKAAAHLWQMTVGMHSNSCHMHPCKRAVLDGSRLRMSMLSATARQGNTLTGAGQTLSHPPMCVWGGFHNGFPLLRPNTRRMQSSRTHTLSTDGQQQVATSARCRLYRCMSAGSDLNALHCLAGAAGRTTTRGGNHGRVYETVMKAESQRGYRY